jgi:serine/threonine-protein phosphatase 6 regulatory subunit 3
MQTGHQLGSSSDDDDDDDDHEGGWLARSTFEMGPPPASARRPLPAHGFDDAFGTASNVHRSFDEPFSSEDDDGFGPFSDSAASGTDPFTFSPHDDGDGFGDFGEFGEFHTGGEDDDGASTPTAESWSFTSTGSFEVEGLEVRPDDGHETREENKTMTRA